jgi:serine/threonine-protein kinase RsbW
MGVEYTLELPSDLDSIERAVEFLVARCKDVGFDEERLRLNFRVGVAEALANAMLYGNGRDPGKSVRIDARCTSDVVTICVTDQGGGFDPATLPDPTLPRNRVMPRGRGVFLIRKLMDRVEFNEQGNSITMVLHRESPAGGVHYST